MPLSDLRILKENKHFIGINRREFVVFYNPILCRCHYILTIYDNSGYRADYEYVNRWGKWVLIAN